MEETVRGSCLCGNIRFEVENQFEKLYLCHCSQCRKITGSAHASNLFISTDQLSWLAGEESIVRYEYPGRDFTKAFCPNCGSGVPFLNKSGSAVIVPAGSLEGEPNIIDEVNIFSAEQPQWSKAASECAHFDGFPK